MKIEQLHSLFLECKGISTDTRKVSNGNMFFALKGDNFNGNTFAQKALDIGAKYVVIDEVEFKTSDKTILVDNVLETLQALASHHRMYLNIPIIALTGSNGKTTTKELINTVLLKKYKTTATIGNLNNHIGVPLTLLSMTSSTQIGIVEMGANHVKEIEFLCNIAKPDYGYITNFGKAHLEGFGSAQGVINGKSELYTYLTKSNKHIFLNADDTIQKEKLNTYIKKFGFSQTDSNYYKIEFTEANPFVSFKIEDTLINSQLIGKYNFTNLCAASIIGKYFNIDLKDIKNALENYTPSNNRSQIIEKGSNKIILDAYNANPTSMKAALENFSDLKDEKKIAFLGDMFELGDSAKQEHQAISNLSTNLNIDVVYLIGDNFFQIENNATKVNQYASFNILKENFNSIDIKNATLLIKGSRGMALERILDLL
ncbi:UDP-N-acetylmuramoyl-tripeptide--D-alanyl-D-alanine ligase [Lacinutrix sp. Bg11-31]|uniref:UDP-N-acetylmuramoyl-tripeptide--D-alanyl-D- alanine ligase n=1 Tax=Lacinutrix sp. Bg11-31 TaxID=2057808 RepID=UPI000C30CB0B|nr:UDP-N-acetylmuramoyl-tripeptide--D-alanyl-D-alanine ligase [Lacinutrix sp. Bg11-31]AUC80615.1 UDP-N-acetylmuramoyl-tripeptide--D-alanyl-D-alanine ligase [Lacinutrix sp. Bg11-31]